jgi:hypothetical protein
MNLENSKQSGFNQDFFSILDNEAGGFIQDFFSILDNETLCRCDLCKLDFVLDHGLFELSNHLQKTHGFII